MQILPHSKDSNQLSKYLEECRQFLDTNKQDKAIETYKSLLKKYSKIKSPKEWVIVTLNLAKAYRDYASVERKHKSIEKAIGLLKKSLEVSEKNNLIYTWEVEYELGISFDLRIKGFPKKNTEISTKHFEKSLQFIADKTYIEKHEKIAAIKYRISRAYLKQLNLGEKIDLDQTISHLSQAQFFYKKKFSGRLDSKEYLIKVGIIKSLGDAYLAKGDHEIKSLDNSIDFYKQALSFRDYYNNLTEINADTKYNLGIIYSKKKLFSEAIKNLRDAIILYQKVNDQESMPKVYEKLGDILVDQDNLNEAIYSFEKSIEFYPKNKCPEKRASLLLKIGTIYGEQLEVNVFNINQGIKNILYGIKCLQKSAEIYKSFFLTSGYFLSRKNLYKLPRYDIQDKIKLIQFKLVNAFKKLLSLYRSFNYNSGMVYAFIQLGILHKNERQEEAISFFEKALECYREDEKIEKRFYIDAKYNLGEILLNRVVGERKENVESAILHLSDALRNNKYLGIQETGYLKEQLGLAYFYRIKGNRSQNIEKAIFYFLKVLQNRDKESNPAECLKIINHLANAYKVRIKGDKQENIEKAIEYFESVLESDMKTYSSDLQAMTYNNLGMIYTERIKGLREKNLEKSVVYFKKTLLVYTKSRFPQKWARTYNNLGTVYLQRIAGSQEKNIEKAIEYFKRALSVQSKDKFPEQWAMVCCNLGIAFSKRIKGYR
uniref:tetratricopeptide repeat protein n=2 Tax=Picosynechococcus TaxID=3079908 RepID=UPI0030DABF75